MNKPTILFLFLLGALPLALPPRSAHAQEAAVVKEGV